jgi:hypothetical protein
VPKPRQKPFSLIFLGLALSEKQISQMVENPQSGCHSKEALDAIELRVKQAL